MDDPSRSERIELYDPGNPDPDLPDRAALERDLAGSSQLRRQLRAIMRWDEQIGAALQDTPVPEGLESRILDRIRSRTAPAQAPSPRPARHRYRTRAARLALAVTATATVALLALLGWKWQSRWTDIRICHRSAEIFHESLHSSESWDERPGPDWPIGYDPSAFRGYRAGVDFCGSPAGVYRLERGGRPVVIIVLAESAFHGPLRPIEGPTDLTRGLVVQISRQNGWIQIAVAWQTQDIESLRLQPSVT